MEQAYFVHGMSTLTSLSCMVFHIVIGGSSTKDTNSTTQYAFEYAHCAIRGK